MVLIDTTAQKVEDVKLAVSVHDLLLMADDVINNGIKLSDFQRESWTNKLHEVQPQLVNRILSQED